MPPAGTWDAVYLSPHLDDAAFSCGGQISARTRSGERVLVVTLFAGDPPAVELPRLARELHELWGLGDDAVELRRREDLQAARVLGCEPIHRDLPEAAYRRGRSGRPLYPALRDLFGEIPPEDLERLDWLESDLRELPPAAEVLAPIAAGGHVDHRLVRRAAERALGPGLLHYEDYPYARKRRVLSKALGRRRRWEAAVRRLEPEDVAARIRAMACYRSQLGTAFSGPDDLARRVRRQVRRTGGERLWRRRGEAQDPGSEPQGGAA